MPKSAATGLGLILVALSIGFNTARYPVVWEMVGPARACEAAPSEPQSSQSEPPQAVEEPVKPIEAAPVDKARADEDAGMEAPPAVAEAPTATHAEPMTRQPLVPVVAVMSARESAIDGRSIRRLPPVDLAGANDRAATVWDGSTPVYPTTGIE